MVLPVESRRGGRWNPAPRRRAARRGCIGRSGGAGIRWPGGRARGQAPGGDAARRAARARSAGRARSRASRTCACIAARRCRWAGWTTGRQPAPDGSGIVGEPCLVCAYHGWSYDRQGVVRRIPAVHGRSIPNRARVARYATAVAVGLIWVLLDPGPGGWEDPSATYPLPRADSWWEQPGFRTIPIETYDWACSAARRVENFVDFSHFPWVHPGVLGDRSKPLSPEHEVSTTAPRSVRHRARGAAGVGQGRRRAGRQGPARPDDVHAPSAALGDARPAPAALARSDPRATTSCCSSPSRRCRRSAAARSPGTRGPTTSTRPPTPGLADFQALILDQDRPIAESQRPEELPVDLSHELHIAGPDRASIAIGGGSRSWRPAVCRRRAGRSPCRSRPAEVLDRS